MKHHDQNNNWRWLESWQKESSSTHTESGITIPILNQFATMVVLRGFEIGYRNVEMKKWRDYNYGWVAKIGDATIFMLWCGKHARFLLWRDLYVHRHVVNSLQTWMYKENKEIDIRIFTIFIGLRLFQPLTMLSPGNIFVEKTQRCPDNLMESASVTSYIPSSFVLV